MEALTDRTHLPLFNGTSFKGLNDQQRIKQIKLKQEECHWNPFPTSLHDIAIVISAAALLVLSGAIFAWGSYGLLSAAVSLTTAGMGDAAIKLLASFILLPAVGLGLRCMDKLPIDPADPSHWENIHEWYRKFPTNRSKIAHADVNPELLEELGFIADAEPYINCDKALEFNGKQFKRELMLENLTEETKKLKEYQDSVLESDS